MFVANQGSTRATDGLIGDASTGSPSKKQQVPESAKDELLQLLTQPFNPEQDQEPIKIRIQQLREHISHGLPGIPPKIPPSHVSNWDIKLVGDLGKGMPDVDTEKLVNLSLQDKRRNGSTTLSPSEIERAARAITELEDPNDLEEAIDLNASTDGIEKRD